MVANAILESAAGIPNVLHSGGACPAPQRNITRPGRLGGDIEYQMGLYLVVAGPGESAFFLKLSTAPSSCQRFPSTGSVCHSPRPSHAPLYALPTTGTTISISNNWYDNDFCWRPDFDVDFGAPLGAAVRTGRTSWARNYTRSTVTVDTSTSSAVVTLLA
jgi:hypothetical protein